MKRLQSIAIAAAMALCGAAPSFAQSSSQVQSQTLPPPPPAVETPAPIVVETSVDLRSGGPQSPESAADARKEAIGALAEARTACRREASRQAREDCLRQAQDDYNVLMGRASRRAP